MKILVLALAAATAAPAAARADELRVLARLPMERRAEMISALRVEVAGRAELLEGEALGDEPAGTGAMRAEARARDATHVVWVVFPSGALAPAEVRVLDVSRTSAAHAMTPQAWDVVDARVVAVLAASLLESEEPSHGRAAATPAPPASSEPAPEPPPSVTRASATLAPAAPADAPALDPEPARGRRPRTFSLWFGVGLAHTQLPHVAGSQLTMSNQLAFYGRVAEWAALGLRLRGGAGYSSVEGALVQANFGLPSIALSFRESLGTAATLELGLHAEGGFYVDWRENRLVGQDRLGFGLGGGVFATLELGAAHGVLLDYTFEVYGLGGSDAWTWGAATLAYVHRWD
ncbi:MAG: hypothetical protein KF729_26700 [Sandaracinaceae bacterium]|nr:hypothetical protein [Sandaracinaceae bacterium]